MGEKWNNFGYGKIEPIRINYIVGVDNKDIKFNTFGIYVF